ncbi:hypothetical protein B0H17DRAFT_1129743 [Mycena rosella]|uniref:Uncharacterized protein n=1 Tax=Mycena rosella TaxID=1033263 RepID=A0AAD7DSJ7_MYCRO|nr:hypothetical protein B0H17DRAFT_1129743 [Mycena rosella]
MSHELVMSMTLGTPPTSRRRVRLSTYNRNPSPRCGVKFASIYLFTPFEGSIVERRLVVRFIRHSGQPPKATNLSGDLVSFPPKDGCQSGGGITLISFEFLTVPDWRQVLKLALAFPRRSGGRIPHVSNFLIYRRMLLQQRQHPGQKAPEVGLQAPEAGLQPAASCLYSVDLVSNFFRFAEFNSTIFLIDFIRE